MSLVSFSLPSSMNKMKIICFYIFFLLGGPFSVLFPLVRYRNSALWAEGSVPSAKGRLRGSPKREGVKVDLFQNVWRVVIVYIYFKNDEKPH